MVGSQNDKRNDRKLRNYLVNNEVQVRVISHGVLYMLAAEHPAKKIRANIVAYFLLTTIVLIALVIAASPSAVAAVVDAMVLLPVILLGSWLGSRLAGKAADQLYRRIAYVFLTGAAIFGLVG